jgi:ABC-type antimicrobial peptide transport system permease subunit
MLAHGVEETLVKTGSEDNVIALRKAANSELVSQIDRDAANIIKTLPEVAVSSDGKPSVTTEVLVIINLTKKMSNDLGNISIRGISPEAFKVRPQVKLKEGKLFQFGTHEIIIGSSIAERFNGCEIGKELKFGGDQWTIVGIFEADGSAFESEIWGDVEQFMPAFGRPVFSTVTMRLTSSDKFEAVKERIQKDPRTQYIELKREIIFYEEQSKVMANFIRILGIIVTVIFSVGAVIGAVITMYAAVSNRTIEIGTLRSLGFRRRNILTAFLIESIILSIIGGAGGIGLASFMSFVQISTVNFGSFAELAFGFDMSPQIVLGSMIFSVVMGIFGGFFPAVRAARLNIVNALRTS